MPGQEEIEVTCEVLAGDVCLCVSVCLCKYKISNLFAIRLICTKIWCKVTWWNLMCLTKLVWSHYHEPQYRE